MWWLNNIRGGGYSWSYKYIHVKKQTQGWVRFVSYRYTAGQCRHILSFLACLSSFIAYYHLLHPAAHVPWNDRSMTMFVWNVLFAAKNLLRPVVPSDTADIPAGGMPITMESMTTVRKALFMLPLYGNLPVGNAVKSSSWQNLKTGVGLFAVMIAGNIGLIEVVRFRITENSVRNEYLLKGDYLYE